MAGKSPVTITIPAKLARKAYEALALVEDRRSGSYPLGRMEVCSAMILAHEVETLTTLRQAIEAAIPPAPTKPATRKPRKS